MPELEKLTKEQIDYFYLFLEYFHNIYTDLRNADLQMHNGKFFDAMDNIRECNTVAQIGEQKVKDFVETLKKSGHV